MGTQTSRKSGVKSTSEKLASSNQGFNPVPAASPDAGAFGDPKETEHSAQDTSFTHDSQRARREGDNYQPNRRGDKEPGEAKGQ